MHSKRYIRLFVIAGFAFVAGLAHSEEMQRIADGVWGGQHIQVDVSSESAKVEFDCAHGTIEGPLTVDANGDFSWRGTFARERGGPITSDDKDSSQPAVYSGSIKEQTMTLAVRLASEKEPLDTFVLTRGKAGQIRKCR
ncbi:MAG TPA: hypothetical protein VLE19_17135 [Pyrinomonadaceae bacterium]|nr:hypothetical protein [Pyrinomonadaceae bacterium]